MMFENEIEAEDVPLKRNFTKNMSFKIMFWTELDDVV